MSRRRDIAAAVSPALVVIVAAWFDTSVIPAAQQLEAQTFDMSGLVVLMPLGTIAIAGACLGLGWLIAGCTPLVGLLCAVAGALLALAPWLGWTVAASINGAPPLLPDPFAQAINEVALRTVGPLNAVAIIGGAMLLAGVVAIARFLRGRRAPGSGAPATRPEPSRA